MQQVSKGKRHIRPGIRFGMRLCAALAVAGTGMATQSMAQTTFDVISPHEYDLPVDFKPFNVLVQYARYQNNERVFDGDGNRADGTDLQSLTGLTKYVRFWTPEFDHRIGLAYEVILSETSLREQAADSPDPGQRSGLGDPLTGFAIWFKPSGKSTLGLQSFMQVPIGASEVSDTNWKNLTSLFWDWRLPAGFGWTADAGAVYQTRRTDDHIRPGMSYHTNERFGWRATRLLEPFVALDAEYSHGREGQPDSWVVDAGPGVMFHTFENQSLAIRYAASIAGSNHDINNSINLRYAYVW